MFTLPTTFWSSAAGGNGANWANYDGTGDKTAVEFSASAIRYCNFAEIDDTRALLVYRGATGYLRARVCTVDGAGDVTFGTEAVLLSSSIVNANVALLDNTHAVAVTEVDGVVWALAIEFSGTTITTVGTAVTLETFNPSTGALSVAAVSSTEFIAGYASSTLGRAFYGSVSGTTVTAGSGINTSFNNSNFNYIAPLAAGTAIMLTNVNSGSNRLGAVLLSVSGTAPVRDTEIQLLGSPVIANEQYIARIDDNRAIGVWTQQNDNTSWAVVITESSGSLAFGTPEQFNSSLSEYTSIAMPNSTQAVVTVGIQNVEIETTVIEISGTTLNALTNYTNATTDKEYVTNIQVGTDTVLIAYEDDNDSSKGKVISARVT